MGMFKNKRSYISFAVIFILFLSALIQLQHIVAQIKKTKRVPVFMPLLVPGEDYSSYDLQRIGAQAAKILERVGRIGPTISLEDMVRGVLFLEEKEYLPLSKKQKIKVLGIIREAYKKREELLDCQRQIVTLSEEIPVLGDKIYGLLTSEQKNYIISNRDNISLKEFEEPSWKNLIGSLEKNIE